MTTDFLPTWTPIWILYFLDSTNLEKKTHAGNNNTMEDYEYKVIKLHATLFQNSSVGRRQWREDTRESGSRRFYPGNSSSFGGCFEMFSRLVFGDQSCWCLDFSWAATPLSRPLLSPLHYRLLPNFTDVLPIFRTFLGHLLLFWDWIACKLMNLFL